MANPNVEGQFYEKGFKPRVPVSDLSFGPGMGLDEKKTAYLELEDSPKFDKFPFETEGKGSSTVAAR